eukprot:TRINITY_DN904_c0_g5_i1.p1 TRINITY_DN904_c0_g5~~TRINITY_DN904_c0_g5_i1.p1  ORF type:complete len:115 (-),score=0.06 TRINITY_DN904_c0_g5_i1:285-629(-)
MVRNRFNCVVVFFFWFKTKSGGKKKKLILSKGRGEEEKRGGRGENKKFNVGRPGPRSGNAGETSASFFCYYFLFNSYPALNLGLWEKNKMRVLGAQVEMLCEKKRLPTGTIPSK